MFPAQDGARLSFVVRELQGKVKREVYRMVPNKRSATATGRQSHEMQKVIMEVPAGYMVYFPRGHVIRVRDKKTLAYYGLDRKPRIINMEGLADPNSPLGRMMSAQDDAARHGAMVDMERMVIQMATAKTGPILLNEQVIEKGE
jgi:hypothetical protein